MTCIRATAMIFVLSCIFAGNTLAHAQSYPKLVFVKQAYSTQENALELDGAARVVGELKEGQQLFIKWQVPEHDISAMWRVLLQSESDQPLLFSVFEPPGETQDSAAPAVKTFGAGPTVAEPQLLWQGTTLPEHWLLKDGLLKDGDYLLQITNQGSATEFQLLLEQEAKHRALRYVKQDTVELTATTNAIFSSALPELTFTIPAPPAGKSWSFQGYTEVGADLNMQLVAADGSALNQDSEPPWLSAKALTQATTFKLKASTDDHVRRVWIQLQEVEQIPEQPAQTEVAQVADDNVLKLFSETFADADLGEEREPNNTKEHATLLPLGVAAKGTLHAANDFDYFVLHNPGNSDFYLSVDAPEPTRLTIVISPTSSSAFQRWQVEGTLRKRITLAEGDYLMSVEGDLATTQPYKVQLEHTVPWANGEHYQPARKAEFAGSLPPDGVIIPVASNRDKFEGWYVLPTHAQERTLSWQGAVHISGYAHYTGLEFIRPNGEKLYSRDYGLNSGSITIPANEQVLVKVTFGGDAKPVTVTDAIAAQAFSPKLNYRLSVPNSTFAAWVDEGQRVNFELTIENLTAEPQVAPVDAKTSHAQASIEGLPQQIELQPHQQQTLNATLKLPAQLEADAAISVVVGAEAFAVSDLITLAASSSAPLQQPYTVTSEPLETLATELDVQWLYSVPNKSALRSPFASKTPKTIARERAEFIVHFTDQRSVTLSQLQWFEHSDMQAPAIEKVAVFGSNQSTGPWQFIQNWELQRDDANVATIAFDKPPTLRYLRLVVDPVDTYTTPEASLWQLPQRISAQRLTLSDSSAEPTPAATLANANNWDHFLAKPGQTATVAIHVPTGQNRIRFTLRESTQGRVQAVLSDAQGEAIPLSWQQSAEQRTATAAEVAPGSYQLQLIEPPRNVMVIWDGSLSVKHFQAPLYQALRRVAQALQPGVEVMQLLPIGGDVLLNDWADNSEQVLRALAYYDNRYSSSNIAQALSTASRALDKVQGEKVIFLVTDGFSDNNKDIDWQGLAEVRPRIFSIQLPVGMAISASQQAENDAHMLAWSHINHGDYERADDALSIARAMFSGMRQIRSGTGVNVTVATDYEKPLPPGTIAVQQGTHPVAAASALQFIFDASGSMLQRMPDGRRIDVAKRVANDVLSTELPAHLPVALRAFGHTEPHSCATELLVAAQQNNHTQVHTAIDTLQAVNLARTPLAASLSAVAEDLADYANGKQLVVLLTDGEETCDGDIPAALAKLQAKGIALQLNIVGFQLNDEALESEFARVAELGAGQYFASKDAAQLKSALALAISPSWRLVDSKQQEVANGRVGDPAQTVAAGNYTLVIDSYPARQTYAVEVEAGNDLLFEVNDESNR